MDRLSFQIGERIEYFMHSAAPYVQYGSQIASNALDYTCDQANATISQIAEMRTSSGIPIQTWLQWHWTWFLENCESIRQHLHHCVSINCLELYLLVNRTIEFFERRVDQTHIYFCLSGIVIGFLIGIRYNQNTKTQPRMRALVCNSYNGVESITMSEEILVPQVCGNEEVIVQIKAASIDDMDLKISSGYGKVIRRQHHLYSKVYGKSQFPFILGRECSGRIVEIGSKVDDFEVGDEIFAAVPYYACGTASEFALMSAEWIAKKPKKLNYEAAASLPYSAAIVWNALVNQALFNQHNTSGKRVLIHTVNNPMGCIAAQLIKAWGGHVTATVSSRGLLLANQLGVDDVIIYDGKDSDFESLLASRTKFDLVVNTVGSYLHDFCKASCKEEGVIVSTTAAHPASDQYGVFFGGLYSLWLRLRLGFQRDTITFGAATISRHILEQVSSLVDNGQLRPIIDKVFDITQAEDAARWAVSGNAVGKVIIRFRNRPLNRLEGFI